jgi:putative FmdB family regulatory protein
MPLYEYECQQCHRRTEKIQKFSDPQLTTCPFCGGALERTLNAPAVHFSGGGWYKDLYSSPRPASASGDAASKPEAAPAGSGAVASINAAAPSNPSNGSGATASGSAPAASPAPAPSSPAKS